MSAKAWGNEYRTTTVCIDSYSDGVPVGRFYNKHFPEGKRFHGVTQFLLGMEQSLDAMDFPKAYTATRAFACRATCESDPPPDRITPVGQKASFAVRILFRQNASWQGSVTWLEGRQEQSFRSVLELILLIDSALACRQAS